MTVTTYVLNKIEAKKKANHQAFTNFLESYNRICEVFTQFDGKVVNVRLARALSDAADWNFHIEDKGIGIKGLSIYRNEAVSYQGGWVYADYTDSQMPLALTDGKRLDATATLDILAKHIKNLEERQAKSVFNREDVLAQLEQLEQLNDQVAELTRSLDWETRDAADRQYHMLRV